MEAAGAAVIEETTLSPLVIQALEFTETYRALEDAPYAIREARCLEKQYPAILEDLRPTDTFAGRRPDYPIVYFGTIWWMAFPLYREGKAGSGKQGGYCVDFSSAERYCGEEKALVTELLDYWQEECSPAKTAELWDRDSDRYEGWRAQVSGSNTGFCMALDLDKLLQKGIPQLIADVEARKERAEGQPEDTDFLDGLLIMLEVFVDTCRHYEEQAAALALATEDPSDRKGLEAARDSLGAIVHRKPQSFHEAIQLLWLYLVMGSGKHIEPGRLDISLGDFYARDIDSGVLSEEEGVQLLEALWQCIMENGEDAVSRAIVGGKGRRNAANADRFAFAAMEATRRHKSIKPQFTLRFHRDQDPRLLQRGYDVIAETGVYPMLYNDDVVVPAAEAIFGVDSEMAPRYYPLGCGEYMLAGCSPSLLDVGWNVPSSLEAALHNGKTSKGDPSGPPTGAVEQLDTFDKLWSALEAQIAFSARLGVKLYADICEGYRGKNAFLFASLLTDDCIEKGSDLFDGGARYMGACIMGHGFTNAADSLCAIERVVFEQKLVSLPELVTVLDSDFEGREDIHKALVRAPKFGNDNDEVDALLVRLWRHLNMEVQKAGQEAGFDFMVISSVNPGGYGMGISSGATADGRREGLPYAIGHAPTAGNDKKGLTALFNSVAKIDATNGGATTNFKVSKDFFTREREKTEALFGTFFACGGTQASITVVNRDELEAALKEPEKYSHVMVRLGGWSARFVDLEKHIQHEIIRRTLY